MDDAKDTPAFAEGDPSAGAKPQAEERILSVSDLVNRCQREFQAYRRGEISDETYGLELLHRAIVQGDQDAWIGVLQCFNENVRGWLYGHPLRRAACHLECEETYVALAFERFWQATVRQQIAFSTLGGALVYLRASLHGAILDTLRTYSRPREVSLPEQDEASEPYAEGQTDSNEVWEVLQNMLASEREQRLAYLLYHCGLKPREIVQFCPREWNDVQEIYRLRRNILDRLLCNADQLRWRLALDRYSKEDDGKCGRKN